MCIQIRREWGSRISDAVPDTVVTLVPFGWGYSVTAYGGAAATGVGHLYPPPVSVGGAGCPSGVNGSGATPLGAVVIPELTEVACLCVVWIPTVC